MGIPIVVATNGYGTPITEAASGYGVPVEVAANGYGMPVVLVAAGGLPVVGSGGTSGAYDSDAQLIFDAFTTPPSVNRKTAINNCVIALKAGGVWAKLDALYLFAAADGQASQVNWKQPGTYTVTVSGSPILTIDQGYTGASARWLSSNFTPSTATTPRYTQNDASVFAWSLSNVNLAAGIVGLVTATSIGILPRTSGQALWTVNRTGAKNVATNTVGSGLFCAVRTGASATLLYRGGVEIGTAADASDTLPAEPIVFLRGQASFWTGMISAAGIGSQLSAVENIALNNALYDYLAAVGAPVGGDITPPVATAFLPADNATDVDVAVAPTVTFTEPIHLGTGNVTLKRTSDNATIEAWDVATEAGSGPGQAEASGSTLTLHLTTTLAGSTEYYLIWDAGVVLDAAGNGVPLSTSTTAWSFTTGRDYDSASDAIFAGFVTQPTTARKLLIDDVVVALKAAGVWAKLDALYAFAAADSQAAKINWKNPGTYNATEVNAPAFTADQGFLGNGTTSYLDSSFNPATATTPNFIQNSANVFGWSLTSTDITAPFLGYVTSTAVSLAPRNGNFTRCIMNSIAAADIIANTDGSGLFVAVRTAASGAGAVVVYRNGTSLLTGATTSAVVPSENLIFLRRTTTYWSGRIAAGGFGSQLSAADNTALYNALRAYMTGVGVP